MAPMFQDAYVKLDQLETETLLSRIGKDLDAGSFVPANTVVMSRALSFYPGHTFYDLADHTHMPAQRRFAIVGEEDDDITILDFTNAPIYALNETCPISLTSENVTDYVRFFFSYVRGRHGRFQIVESVDDINWREEPPPPARKAVGKMISPITSLGVDEEGVSHFMAQMIFRDSLFQSNISVDSEGLVKLSNEQLMIEDMPVMDDTFGQ